MLDMMQPGEDTARPLHVDVDTSVEHEGEIFVGAEIWHVDLETHIKQDLGDFNVLSRPRRARGEFW